MKRFVFTPTRLAWAVLVSGVAAWGVMWVLTYESLTSEGRKFLIALPGLRGATGLYASPVWAIPVAALIAISAVAADFLILRRR